MDNTTGYFPLEKGYPDHGYFEEHEAAEDALKRTAMSHLLRCLFDGRPRSIWVELAHHTQKGVPYSSCTLNLLIVLLDPQQAAIGDCVADLVIRRPGTPFNPGTRRNVPAASGKGTLAFVLTYAPERSDGLCYWERVA